MTTRKKTIFVGCLFILFFLLYQFLTKSNSAIAKSIRSKSSRLQTTHKGISIKNSIYRDDHQPIELFGKVVDMKGVPVEAAEIKINIAAGANEPSKLYTLASDANGLFYVKNETGSSIEVQVYKQGYIKVPDNLHNRDDLFSIKYFDFSNSMSDDDKEALRNPNKPILFHLYKNENSQAVKIFEWKGIEMPVDGKVQNFTLYQSPDGGLNNILTSFKGTYHLLPVTNDILSKKFDWQFRMKMIGGGFIKRKNQVDYVAPESAYKEEIVYDFTKDSTVENWKNRIASSYFVKFPSGIYGRIDFEVDGRSRKRPLSMKVFIGEETGNRNLTIDEEFVDGFRDD